ncbi:MAG TPA: TonB-dependent receptor [Bryobacteraceae bacterium]
MSKSLEGFRVAVRTAAAVLVLWPAAAAAAGNAALEVVVRDQSAQPVPGVAVELKSAGRVIASDITAADGRVAFPAPSPGVYEIGAAKDGFEPFVKSDLNISSPGGTSLDLTLTPALARQESVEVHGTVSPVDRGASPAADVPAQSAKELPSRPATVADALPLIPGVVRSPGGGLQISGAGEQRSALIVNSADVTDPATGQFGLTVPIDSVQTLSFYQTPFLAEYGRFTAGLVSVETRRGGEKWKWELNDPLPDFRIRSHRLEGLRDATPRLNVEGPLIPGKLYFSEGLEYAIRKTEVYTLPFPNNQTLQEGVNSFAQLDWMASSRQWLTATVHVAPQRLGYVNMNFYNPQPTTPDASTHNYTATVADHLTFWGGVFDNTFSFTQFSAGVWGQGNRDLTITPTGNSGNYFVQQARNASRASWSPVYSFAQFNGLGSHSFKMGAYLAASSDNGQLRAHPVNILDAAGRLIERITFTGGQPFRMSDSEFAFFGQDHWLLSPRLALDLGIRTESQTISEAVRVAPRAGIAWSPLGNARTVLRAGFGFFYDRVPLNVYSFSSYPSQVATMYNPAGGIAAGPFVYRNVLDQVAVRFPLVSQEPAAGNFSPRSATGRFEIEQPFGQLLKLRVGYMQNAGSGLVILNPTPADPVTGTGLFSLTGGGSSRYHQFDTTARLHLGAERELIFSYVRNHARGDLNDFSGFLGSFPSPIVRPNQFGYLPADLPNRFLAWGLVKLPYGFRIAPVIEYRTGLPYVATDAYQQYAGIPNLSRFPDFLSVDSRFSKDFKVNPKYSVRFSISGFNLTNHFNPEAVRSNIADAAYGYLFGQRGRRFTADFDVLF